uniref:Uncharacterized protein LOC104232317 n=1 Tax=Nicotiana sylvestris TaxID=4096 RepID=A0A1U7XBG6_NICSY|nr:PREDICTED: uncharacterized protein LOC104232317 [Nicotiana sylvestris]
MPPRDGFFREKKKKRILWLLSVLEKALSTFNVLLAVSDSIHSTGGRGGATLYCIEGVIFTGKIYVMTPLIFWLCLILYSLTPNNKSACFIQAAWRRHCRNKLEKFSREEEDRLKVVLAKERLQIYQVLELPFMHQGLPSTIACLERCQIISQEEKGRGSGEVTCLPRVSYKGTQ